MKATEGKIRNCALNTDVLPCGSNFFITCPNVPDWRIPSLTRNSRATVIMPLLLNPSSISFGVRIPAHKNKTTTEKSIMPGRILSATKAATIPNNDNSTNTISNVI